MGHCLVLAQHKIFNNNITDVFSNANSARLNYQTTFDVAATCKQQSPVKVFNPPGVCGFNSLVDNISYKRFAPEQLFRLSTLMACLSFTENSVVLTCQQ